MDFQQKDNNKLAMINNNSEERKESNDSHSRGRFLATKLDKLATAVYLVTDFLSDKEPLKWDLRKLALKIVDRVSEAKYEEDVLVNVLLNNASQDLNKIISLLSVGMNISGVSRMNFNVLKEEFEGVLNSLLKQDNFSEQINRISLNSGISMKNATEKVEEKNIVSYRKENEIQSEKSEVKAKSENQAKSGSRLKGKESTIPSKKKDRQGSIINYIRNHGWSSITDIATVDSDCSLKTIQRELASLVGSGVLKKKGERRWSRYQVV